MCIVAPLLYLAAVAATDRAAHNMLYPLIRDGYPLTGWRRGLVALFAPFIFVGIGVARLPMFLLMLMGVSKND